MSCSKVSNFYSSGFEKINDHRLASAAIGLGFAISTIAILATIYPGFLTNTISQVNIGLGRTPMFAKSALTQIRFFLGRKIYNVPISKLLTLGIIVSTAFAFDSIFMKKRSLNVHSLSTAEKFDCLIGAIMKNEKKTVSILAKQKDLLKMKNEDGDMPIHVASALGRLDCIKSIVKNGGDIHAQDIEGATPLHIASEIAHKDVVEFLLGKGAYIHAKAKNGDTPIQRAVVILENTEEIKKYISGHSSVIYLLVNHGASLDQCNKKRYSPRDLMKLANLKEMIDSMEKKVQVSDAKK